MAELVSACRTSGYEINVSGLLRTAALSWRDRVRPSLAAAATTTRYLYGQDDLIALREVPLCLREVRA